jgi:C_GCAxxG_C_C family probable redox protein
MDVMSERERKLDEVFQRAFKNEITYTGCCQTVLAALKEEFPEITAEVVRSGSALAGGVARRGESCGALIGAIIAVSAVTGRQELQDIDQYQRAMDLGNRVFEHFKRDIGHTVCAEIQKLKYERVYNLMDAEEREKFRAIGCRNPKGCPVVCGTAARIAAGILWQDRSV